MVNPLSINPWSPWAHLKICSMPPSPTNTALSLNPSHLLPPLLSLLHFDLPPFFSLCPNAVTLSLYLFLNLLLPSSPSHPIPSLSLNLNQMRLTAGSVSSDRQNTHHFRHFTETPLLWGWRKGTREGVTENMK